MPNLPHAKIVQLFVSTVRPVARQRPGLRRMSCSYIYYDPLFALLSTILSQTIIACFVHLDMSEEHQQSSEVYTYEVETPSNTVPPMPHGQPTSMPWGWAGTVSSIADVSLWCGALIAAGVPDSSCTEDIPG